MEVPHYNTFVIMSLYVTHFVLKCLKLTIMCFGADLLTSSELSPHTSLRKFVPYQTNIHTAVPYRAEPITC